MCFCHATYQPPDSGWFTSIPLTLGFSAARWLGVGERPSSSVVRITLDDFKWFLLSSPCQVSCSRVFGVKTTFREKECMLCEPASHDEVSGEVRWSETLAEEFQTKKKEKEENDKEEKTAGQVASIPEKGPWRWMGNTMLPCSQIYK